jgi:Replication initiator protein A
MKTEIVVKNAQNLNDSAPMLSDNPGELEEITEIASQEFVSMEKNIAAFGFFSPSSKRSKKNTHKIIKFTQKLDDGKVVEAKVTISGNAIHGMPTTADQDKYLAFQKILERSSRKNGEISNPICFTSAELLRILGQSRSGYNFKEVTVWLDVMASTFIKSEGAIWRAGIEGFASDSFVIFQRVKRAGQKLDDGTVTDRNLVWLSDWYLENINAHYLLPVDFDTYRRLKSNIAKALIPLLQIWLYASRDKEYFEKRYKDLCQLLQITKYNYLSKIEEKLSPAFVELVAQKFISKWEILKTKDGEDYKIRFWHGEKFYENYFLRNSKKLQIRTASKPRRKKKKSPAEVRSLFDDEIFTLFNRLCTEFGIDEEKAQELINNHSIAEVRNQIEALPFRNSVEDMSGFLIRAIEKNFSLPPKYLNILSRREKEEEDSRLELEIDSCSFCDDFGTRYLKTEDDSEFGEPRKCTHNRAVESQYEDIIFNP